jgi:hypothetical protein
MPKYRITMINNGVGTVVVYGDYSNPKAAYDAAVAGAVQIFGSSSPDKPHAVIIVEEPA